MLANALNLKFHRGNFSGVNYEVAHERGRNTVCNATDGLLGFMKNERESRRTQCVVWSDRVARVGQDFAAAQRGLKRDAYTRDCRSFLVQSRCSLPMAC